jgi:hypothetical protein
LIDGWTGFTADHPDYCLGVTTFNVVDPSVALARVTGEAYNFDFSVPFGIQDLQDRVDSVPDIQSAGFGFDSRGAHEPIDSRRNILVRAFCFPKPRPNCPRGKKEARRRGPLIR